MPTGLESFGLQVAQGAAGAAMGLMLEGHNDQRQLDQQRRLQQMQLEGNKEMADYMQEKQMALWNATNYKAQMKHMREAGLNPGLMYGMTGGGGATAAAAPGAGVQGAHAPTGGGEAMGMSMHATQLGLLQAQKANIEADTANKQADTANKPLTGEQIKATTTSLLQGVENAKVQKDIMEIERSIKQVEDYIKGRTQNAAIGLIMTELAEATERLHMRENEALISKQTVNEKIGIIKGEYLGVYLRNALTQAQTSKTRSDIQVNNQAMLNMAAKIAQDWVQLENQGINISSEERKRRNDIWVDDMQKSTGLPVDIIEKGIQAIILKNFLQPGGTQPVRGFHNR